MSSMPGWKIDVSAVADRPAAPRQTPRDGTLKSRCCGPATKDVFLGSPSSSMAAGRAGCTARAGGGGPAALHPRRSRLATPSTRAPSSTSQRGDRGLPGAGPRHRDACRDPPRRQRRMVSGDTPPGRPTSARAATSGDGADPPRGRHHLVTQVNGMAQPVKVLGTEPRDTTRTGGSGRPGGIACTSFACASSPDAKLTVHAARESTPLGTRTRPSSTPASPERSAFTTRRCGSIAGGGLTRERDLPAGAGQAC